MPVPKAIKDELQIAALMGGLLSYGVGLVWLHRVAPLFVNMVVTAHAAAAIGCIMVGLSRAVSDEYQRSKGRPYR